MKILEVSTLSGPNYWSVYRHRLIVMKVDLEDLEDYPTDRIDGFFERLSTLLPSLQSHRCSLDREGGFFERVKRGTWIGHVIEHIALEIQTLAGMDCGFGRTRGTGHHGVYNVIFSYEFERAGRYAAKAAFRMAEALVRSEKIDLEEIIEDLKDIKSKEELGPSTSAIVEEAKKRGIPFRRADKHSSQVIFGQGVYQKTIRATMTGNTSSMAVEMACDKDATKKTLSRAYIPVPEGRQISDVEDLHDVISDIGFPLVLKPVDGNHGRGITTNINSVDAAIEAFDRARQICRKVIAERFVQGFDYRFLVINYKLVAVAKRTPAMIIGDGYSTVQQLIDEVNTDPRRGEGHTKVLTAIKVDKVTLGILEKNNLSTDSILPVGKTLVLKDTANLSTGGTSEDVTDAVHPFNVKMAERIARLVNLDICGIDIMAMDVTKPITKENGAVLEVNACPGFRMHTHPSSGLPRNAGEAVMQMLYPEESRSRVPLVAITGTNGKTTTTRLVSHLAKGAGYSVGFTTTDGIFINGHCIHKGDCTGPVSAEAILTDPTVDFAVIECARGGILRSGLGFDSCDVSIVTNISADHLGIKGIDTLEQMARVKAVVAQSTKESGYCILNADDDLVYAMKDDVHSNIALFSTRMNNPRIRQHCEAGGMAAVIEKGYLTICKGLWKIRLEKLSEIPLSMDGRASAMIKNILPATLAAVLSNFSIDHVKSALRSFIPSPEFTPGRMNLFRFSNFEVMVDYAHNVGGFEELKRFMTYTKATKKTGIVAAIGDRRDEDIKMVGTYAAKIFDEVIIRHDLDLRGRSKEEFNALVMEGIREVNPGMPVMIISDELDALQYAIDNAIKGSIIVTCTDSVQRCIDFVSKARENEQSQQKQYEFSKAS